MSNIRSTIEDITNHQTVFVLTGLQKRFFPDWKSDEKINRVEVDFDTIRTMLADWAEVSSDGEATIKDILEEEERASEGREALADIGLGEGFIAITTIIGLVYMQMHADTIRGKSPDKETRPDGTIIERKLFSITDVLEKSKQLIPKEFWGQIAEWLKGDENNNPQS